MCKGFVLLKKVLFSCSLLGSVCSFAAKPPVPPVLPLSSKPTTPKPTGATSPANVAGSELQSPVFSSAFLQSLAVELTCKPNPEERLTSFVLSGVSQDSHSFRLTPSQRAKLEVADKANSFFYLGSAWEHWLPGGLQSKPLFADVKENDPHVWNSVRLTVKLAIRLKTRLAALQPQHSNERETCLFAFQDRATRFLAESKALVAKIPENQRVVGVEHDAFRYLSSEYGVKFLALAATPTDGGVTPNQLKQFAEQLQSQKVKSLLGDFSHDSKTLEVVSKDLKLPVAGKLFSEGVGGAGSGAETIEKMWLHNRNVLLKAVK